MTREELKQQLSHALDNLSFGMESNELSSSEKKRLDTILNKVENLLLELNKKAGN